MTTQEANAVEREIRIAARPETVFEFFTDPGKMVRWMGIKVALDPQPGGIFRVEVNSQAIARGEYVELVPHSRVVFSFGWDADGHPIPPGSTTVEVSLSPDGDGTLVRLSHHGLPVDAHGDHAHGWEHYLGRLGVVVTGGDPGPDPFAASQSEAGTKEEAS